MFFFVGGISPQITQLDDTPVLCPVCGLAQAYYKRVDHYLNVFFIPLFRVKKGEPFLMCNRCERSVSEMGDEYHRTAERMGQPCRCCGRVLRPDFEFCPHCGRKREE